MEKQGSSYEGMKTRSSSLEFDCMVVLCGGDSLTVNDAGCPRGFSKLQVKHVLPASQIPAKIMAGRPYDESEKYTDPEKVVHRFYGELQIALNILQLSHRVKLRRHGDTAVQMDVLDENSLWYSVDMVPGLAVNGSCFVAKSSKAVPYTWRQSFAQTEKRKWSNIDRNNLCHKMVARMIKVIRETDDTMKPLQSYAIKTALMNLDRDRHLSWSQRDLGKRFVDVLASLRDCMDSGMLPHHYLGQDLNVLEVCLSNPVHLANMTNRLDRLLNSEHAMGKVLNKRVLMLPIGMLTNEPAI